jgi:hypothetical protein
MYRPVQQPQGNSVKATLFSDKNYNTLQTVLIQDFQERTNTTLDGQQINRLSKTLDHYLSEVYQIQGEKPLQLLNKDVLSATAKDFSKYLQRKEITKNTSPVKNVMDNNLFQETSQRFERLTQERNEVKALPPPMPDFRISLDEDTPPAAEMFERAKKQREFEALRSTQNANEMMKAEAGLQNRNMADTNFREQQDMQNRNTDLVLAQRQYQSSQRPSQNKDVSLAIMPDRRELLLAPVGSFDTMSASPPPRDLGQANSNVTIIQPQLASPTINSLPQNNVVREDSVLGYREIENNLFIYSADRDWLRNYKENRYSFTINFDISTNGALFGISLSSEQKFKNIVRIELVKAIMAGEGLDVTVDKKDGIASTTSYQDNILNFPYVVVSIPELDNNNYGTDDLLNRAFGVLQYDAQWRSDDTQIDCSKGYLAMIPKFLKCQKDYYPTPLSTLQKLTIEIRRPNGKLVSNTPDTYDVGGIVAQTAGLIPSVVFPFNANIATSTTVYKGLDGSSNPYNIFINTTTYFSKFEICKGDRIQISGYRYSDAALNGVDGPALSAFSNWINRIEGHIVIDICNCLSSSTNVLDGSNTVGYSNFIVIQALYTDPKTGSTTLQPFGTNIGTVLSSNSPNFLSPCRLINLNKQLNLVFRIITREMDSLPQIRPDNNY